jgi:hypothetical protein
MLMTGMFCMLSDKAQLIFASGSVESTHPNSLTGGKWAAFEDGRIELPQLPDRNSRGRGNFLPRIAALDQVTG